MLRLAVILIFAAGFLSGCDDEKTRNLVDQRAMEAKQSLTDANAAQASPAKRYNPLVVTDRIWAGGEALRRSGASDVRSVEIGSHAARFDGSNLRPNRA